MEISLRGYFDRRTAFSSVWAPFYNYRHFFFSFIIVFPVALLLIIWPRCSRHIVHLRAATATYVRLPRLAVQLVAYTGFALLTYTLSVRPEAFSGFTSLALLAWLALLLATAIASLLALAPGNYWHDLFGEEKTSIALAATAALLATGFSLWLQSFTPTLAFGALHGSHALLSFFYDPLILDVAERVIGTNNFTVRVSNACAGYEGVALITVFLSIYLWLFRRDFYFPRALLAFPVGLVAVFLFNVVRIAALIAIGDSVSPAVALAGFHSNAGWISFLAIFVGLIWLLHTVPFFARPSPQAADNKMLVQKGVQTRVVDALLVPLAVLLASILVLGALSAGFDQLYPIKVVATGLALWSFRYIYSFSEYRISFFPVAIGIFVFTGWMLLVPASAEQSEIYTTQFSQWPAATVFVWVTLRLLGSVVTVPLAEELAFRGYLLARLGGKPPAISSHLPFSLFAFSASSLLFGLLHGDWLAGTLAGMAYAWVRYRRGLLGDAVIAHMTTNLLISIHVLLTQQWSYW